MKRTVATIILLVVSFGIGVGIGLGISWGILPAKNKDVTPAVLNKSDKDIYRSFIAESFSVAHDIARAKIRLELLDGESSVNALKKQMESASADQIGVIRNNALMILYAALVNAPVFSPTIRTTLVNNAQATLFETLQTNNPGSVFPYPTGDPTTSVTTLPGKSSTYLVRKRAQVCDSSQQPPLLQVMIFDQYDKPDSGVVVIISSAAGSERILTGLKPEVSAGYVDFLLTPGVHYSMVIEGAGENPIEVITAGCLSLSGEKYPGGWLFEIQH